VKRTRSDNLERRLKRQAGARTANHLSQNLGMLSRHVANEVIQRNKEDVRNFARQEVCYRQLERVNRKACLNVFHTRRKMQDRALERRRKVLTLKQLSVLSSEYELEEESKRTRRTVQARESIAGFDLWSEDEGWRTDLPPSRMTTMAGQLHARSLPVLPHARICVDGSGLDESGGAYLDVGFSQEDWLDASEQVTLTGTKSLCIILLST
jgi:hypothetical protein